LIPNLDDPNVGHVGGLVRCVEMKLKDVPELDYTTEDRDKRGRL